MQKRVAALKTGSPAKFVSQSGAQRRVWLGLVERFSTLASATLPYPGLDGHPRRITPIPVSLPMLPTEKTSLRPVPEPPSKSDWDCSKLPGRWFKTPKMVEEEKRAGL